MQGTPGGICEFFPGQTTDSGIIALWRFHSRTITAKLRQAIEQACDEPVRIEDPDTHTAYVLVKAEVFDRMRFLEEVEEIDPSFFEIDDFEPARENPR